MTNYELNDNWTLWLHMPNDIDWSINSYKKVYKMDTLHKLICINEKLDETIVTNCMLFIMKNNIKPIWEDENNNKGGCFSYKIPNNLVYKVWKTMVYLLLGNTLCDAEILENITGISISPKKSFCIIKLWLSNTEKVKEHIIYNFINSSINNENIDIDPFNLSKLCNIDKQICIFKKHKLLY